VKHPAHQQYACTFRPRLSAVMYLNDLTDSRCYTGFRIFLTITTKHISNSNHHTFPLPTVGTKCIGYTCRFAISRNRFATLTKTHSVCVHYYLKQSQSLLSQHPYYILQYTNCRYGAVNYSPSDYPWRPEILPKHLRYLSRERPTLVRDDSGTQDLTHGTIPGPSLSRTRQLLPADNGFGT
jgi:hypothetical protein